MTKPADTPKIKTGTKHGELTQTLRARVAEMQPGDKLPTQDELMRQYQVSDRTVLRSLDDLRREGWIVRRQGIGTFVADPSQRQQEPNTSSLVSAPSRAIAALALTNAFWRGSYYRYCADKLAEPLEKAGLSLLCHLASSGVSYEDAQPLEALNPRGFVLFGYHLAPVGEWLVERGHRVIVAGAPPISAEPVLPCVYAEHEYGGHLATSYLLGLGHRRIAFSFHNVGYQYADTVRWQGHQRAIEEVRSQGKDVQDEVFDAALINTWRANPELAAAHFRRPNGPTAVVAWNDFCAYTMLSILHRAGLRVPEDVSVIGFDGMPESEESVPALTTVDQHVDRQMQLIVNLLSRPSPLPESRSVVVVPSLVERSSCAPPPTS